MKRKLIIVGAVFLVLIVILGGLFFWKGGHHALYLADMLEDWLEADTGAAAVTFQLQRPDYAVDPDTGRFQSLGLGQGAGHPVQDEAT